MSIPFGTTIRHVNAVIAAALPGFLGAPCKALVNRHELLWDCYLSGQMDGADLEREIAADPGFTAFVAAQWHN